MKSFLPSFKEFLLAAVMATEASVAFDAAGGASVKAFAEELMDLADATQVFGSESGTFEGHVFAVPGELSHWCAHDGGPQRVRSGDDGEASCPEGARCRSLLDRFPYLRCHEVWCGCW